MDSRMPSILVADDDVDTCRNLADILAGIAGYLVEIAHDGATALERVCRCPYDMALLDLRMPGMDGLTLCRHIKQVRPEMVAVLVTAYSGGLAGEAHAAGIWRILAKPIDIPRLLTLVDERLARSL
jgi:two-component system, NtrC family, response regulator HydG